VWNRVLGNGVTAICDDMVKNIGIESLVCLSKHPDFAGRIYDMERLLAIPDEEEKKNE
jgi:hypothetical protein